MSARRKRRQRPCRGRRRGGDPRPLESGGGRLPPRARRSGPDQLAVGHRCMSRRRGRRERRWTSTSGACRTARICRPPGRARRVGVPPPGIRALAGTRHQAARHGGRQAEEAQTLQITQVKARTRASPRRVARLQHGPRHPRQAAENLLWGPVQMHLLHAARAVLLHHRAVAVAGRMRSFKRVGRPVSCDAVVLPASGPSALLTRTGRVDRMAYTSYI
mmetsp:Transcript_11303/g.33554  ORF Transcript_11303/g.33554 Transcript_11303/m.33554 type:complete len:218 (+) Transcript_11303:616-1269(+)